MIENAASKSRRNILAGTAGTLSAAGLFALLDKPARAAGGNPAQDVQLLNSAVAVEHEGIAAYQIGAESKLLSPDILKVALIFQGHHKQHRDDLLAAIKRLGGTGVQAKTQAEYASALGTSALKDQNGVLHLALKLEHGATDAYLGIVTSLDQPELSLLVSRNAADEAFHAGVLGHVLGEGIPQKAPMFG